VQDCQALVEIRADKATSHHSDAKLLPDRDAAKLWMLHHARARRNLTPTELSYIRGAEYNLKKKAPHRPKADKEGGNTYHLKTAETLADAHGVSEKTIRNDAKYAAAIDEIAGNLGVEVKQSLLAGFLI